MAERTAGAILEKRLPEINTSPLAQNIKSALDTLAEISTNLETLKNGNAELNAVVDESLLGVREARSRVLGRVPQVLWISDDDVFSHTVKPNSVRREFLISKKNQEEKVINRGTVVQTIEVPDGAQSVSTVLGNLGINANTYLKLTRELGIEKIRIGEKYYLTLESQNMILELVQREKGMKDGEPRVMKSKKPEVKTSYEETGLGDGWITSNEVLSILGIKRGNLKSVLAGEREKLDITKVGARNHFRREQIEALRDRRSAKLERKGTTSTKSEVKDSETGSDYGIEDGQSLDIYFEEVRRTSHDALRNRNYAKNVLKGQFALSQLEKILESGVMTGEINVQIETFLALPRAKFLLNSIKNTANSSREEDKGKNKGSYLTAKSKEIRDKWIDRRIKNSENINNGVLETIIKNSMEDTEGAFDSYDNLVRENLKLAMSLAYKLKGRGLPVADLIGFGNEGLMIAASKFNYKTGYVFSTYATWWIRQKISRGIIDTGSIIRLPTHVYQQFAEIIRIKKDLMQTLGREPKDVEVARKVGISVSKFRSILNSRNTDSLNRMIGSEEDTELEDRVASVDIDYEGGAHRAELREVVENALGQLKKRERKVIEIHFGLGKNQRSQTLEAAGNELGVTRERARQIEAGAIRKLQTIMRTYALGLKSDLLKNRRKSKGKSQAIDLGDKKVANGYEVIDRETLDAVMKAQELDTEKGVDSSEIVEVDRRFLKVIEDIKTNDYCGSGEIASILDISKRRWHQIKKDYQYRSKMIGKSELILREDLMVIKFLREEVKRGQRSNEGDIIRTYE